MRRSKSLVLQQTLDALQYRVVRNVKISTLWHPTALVFPDHNRYEGRFVDNWPSHIYDQDFYFRADIKIIDSFTVRAYLETIRLTHEKI